MRNKRLKKLFLSVEFILLFFGVPIILVFDDNIIHPSAILLPIVIIIGLYLRKHPVFKFKDLVKFGVSNAYIKTSVLVFLITAILLTAAVYIFDRNNLFNLIRHNFLIWTILCVFYPIFSAYMQEIIYRTFIFTRYNILFKNKTLMILASGMAFSFVHIFYYSAISMIITLIGGIFLAYVYEKTKSVLFAAILHGIFGDLIFTVGLGHYFWLDMDKFM